jgi:hypothetical protein
MRGLLEVVENELRGFASIEITMAVPDGANKIGGAPPLNTASEKEIK